MEHEHDFNVPPIESIFNLDAISIAHKKDSNNVHGGINDIWHRLWAALSFEYQFPDMHEKSLKASYMIRKELEAALGIVISDEQCDQLRIHAINHAKQILNKE